MSRGHGQFLHQPPHFRLGAGHRDHARRRTRHHDAPHRAIPEHRPARHLHPGDLPGRLGRHGAKLGHAGHRAAAERHRSPAVFRLRERCGREHDHHALLRAGHQSRHRPGAGAEQTAAGHTAPAARGAAGGAARRQGHAQFPPGDRLLLERRLTQQRGRQRLHRLQCSGSDQPHTRGRRLSAVRYPVRHAHLAGPGQAQ